jgi:hypothetical protein
MAWIEVGICAPNPTASVSRMTFLELTFVEFSIFLTVLVMGHYCSAS